MRPNSASKMTNCPQIMPTLPPNTIIQGDGDSCVVVGPKELSYYIVTTSGELTYVAKTFFNSRVIAGNPAISKHLALFSLVAKLEHHIRMLS